jgi:hypothetical protein
MMKEGAPLDPAEGPALTELIRVLGPEHMQEGYQMAAAARSSAQMNTVFMNDRNTEAAGRAGRLLQLVGDGNQSFAQTLIFTHSGARAVAFRALNLPTLSEIALSKYKEIQRAGAPDNEKVRGFTWSETVAAIDKVAHDPDMVLRVQALDTVYQRIFEGRPDLYIDFAHSPFLIPYIFARILHPGVDPEMDTSVVNTIKRTDYTVLPNWTLFFGVG